MRARVREKKLTVATRPEIDRLDDGGTEGMLRSGRLDERGSFIVDGLFDYGSSYHRVVENRWAIRVVTLAGWLAAPDITALVQIVRTCRGHHSQQSAMTHLSMVRQWVLAKGSSRMLREIYLYVIEAILMLSQRWS